VLERVNIRISQELCTMHHALCTLHCGSESDGKMLSSGWRGKYL